MTTFTYNGTEYKTNHKNYFARIVDGKKEMMPKADFMPIFEAYKVEQKALAEQAESEASAPVDPEPTSAPEATEAPKTRKHPTADAFLANIPATYIFRTNAKGHILISKAEGDKTAYARIRPLKDGAYIFPGKTLKATRSDWEHHEGWANEYALKVANWDEVATVLGF